MVKHESPATLYAAIERHRNPFDLSAFDMSAAAPLSRSDNVVRVSRPMEHVCRVSRCRFFFDDLPCDLTRGNIRRRHQSVIARSFGTLSRCRGAFRCGNIRSARGRSGAGDTGAPCHSNLAAGPTGQRADSTRRVQRHRDRVLWIHAGDGTSIGASGDARTVARRANHRRDVGARPHDDQTRLDHRRRSRLGSVLG